MQAAGTVCEHFNTSIEQFDNQDNENGNQQQADLGTVFSQPEGGRYEYEGQGSLLPESLFVLPGVTQACRRVEACLDESCYSSVPLGVHAD